MVSGMVSELLGRVTVVLEFMHEEVSVCVSERERRRDGDRDRQEKDTHRGERSSVVS